MAMINDGLYFQIDNTESEVLEMSGERQYSTTFSWDSELSADSVEFCPVTGYQDILVVGTYSVTSSDADSFSPSQRKGRVYLAQLKDNRTLEVIQTLDTDAVLDMKWSHSVMSQPLVAVADAKGTVSIYALTLDKCLKLQDKASIKDDASEEDLALSLDWNDRRKGFDQQLQLAVSGSRGNVVLFDVFVNDGDNGGVSLVKSTRLSKCHEFEAWIVAFDVHSNGGLVFTGGDDAALKVFDLRVATAAQMVNRKHHGAGVTSLLSDVHREHRFYSGSYDDTLAAWDSRSLRCPVETAHLSGGVWRIRQHPRDPEVLAVAAMYNGFHLFDIENNASSIHYTEHDSIAYGVDFCVDGTSTETQQWTLVSCSFYDHSVKVWNVASSPL